MLTVGLPVSQGAVGGAPMDEAGRDAEDSQVASTDWLKRSAWGEEEGEVWEGAKYWKFRRPKDGERLWMGDERGVWGT